MLTLVIGPCGAGKSTYARTAYPRAYHPDAEALLRTLYTDPDRDFRLHPHLRALGRHLVETATERLLAAGADVVVTARGATRAERAAYTRLAANHQASTHIVRLATPADECIRRAQTDPARPATSRRAWPAIVANWLRDWQPVQPDTEHVTYQEHTGC